MNRTLPLFEELPAPGPGQAAGRPAPEGQPAEPGAPRDSAHRHLKAAWRLSRAMGRFPDRSAQQTRAGRAICQHLQALLAEAGQSRR